MRRFPFHRRGPLALAVLAVLAVPPAGRGEEPATAAVEIALDGYPEGLAEPARLVLVPKSGGEPVRAATSRPSTRVVLPSPGVWEVRCSHPEYWCGTAEVDVTAKPGAARIVSLGLPFLPWVPLGGTVAGPGPRRLVAQVVIHEARGGSALGSVRADVDVAADGRFALRVPRAVLDLRLAAGGFAPIYRWSVDLRRSPEDGDAGLGDLAFGQGGSVVGRVVDEGGDPVERARVVAFPGRPEGGVSRSDASLAELSQETVTSDRGFFQLTDLRSSAYTLLVSKGTRSAPATGVVRVEPEAETRLDVPIVLREVADLDVAVVPVRHPDGPWTVRLVPDASSPTPGEWPLEQEATEAGLAFFGGLRAGAYEIGVLSPAAETIHRETVDVGGPAAIELDVPITAVRGRVRRDDEPLLARVTLTAAGADRVGLDTDEDGEFEGWMRTPDEDAVLVHVEALVPRIQRSLVLSDLEYADGTLVLDVDLGGKELRGRVLRADGEVADGSLVLAMAGEVQLSKVVTGVDGEFSIPALDAEREVHVQAHHPSFGESRRLDLDLASLGDSTFVELVLEERRSLSGVVRGPGGEPISGGEVEVLTLGPSSSQSRQPIGLDGSYHLRVPAAAEAGLFRVYSPTHGLWSGCREIATEVSDLALAPPVGSAEVVVRGPATEPIHAHDLYLISASGGLYALEDLETWMTRRGVTPTVAREEDGQEYRLQVDGLPRDRYALVSTPVPSWLVPTAHCAGQLAPAAAWIPVGGALPGELVFEALDD